MKNSRTNDLLAALLFGFAGLMIGCETNREDRAERAAQNAVGVEDGTETSVSTEAVRDVTIHQEKSIIDNQTGEVLEQEVRETPVQIRKERTVTTDVEVESGQTRVRSSDERPE